jgi:hypothetical protein
MALSLSLVFALSFETLLRARGLVPSVTDDVQLWSLTRSEVTHSDPDEVVLIGASRIQTDIDPDVFASLMNGRKPRQLAIAGANTLPVLSDLLQDESFKGLIICDVMSIYFFSGLDLTHGPAAEYVSYARRDTWWDRATTRARAFLESHLAFRAPDVSDQPGALLRALGLRPLARQFSVVDADRYTHLDRRPEEVSQESVAELARVVEQVEPASQERFDRDLGALSAAVRRFHSRGGRVVFTTLPVSGVRREVEERRFPRTQFWDKFAARVGAPTIHFKDYPALSRFVCHDGSHLTVREAPDFTRAFVSIVKTKLNQSEEMSQISRLPLTVF